MRYCRHIKINKMETQVQTLPNIVEIQRIMKDAPATLTANLSSKAKALQAADALIAAHKAHGMNEAIDTNMATFVEKGKKTIKTLNEKRKPFTQMMDELKKQFTGCETEIAAKVNEVQALRDAYATELMEARRLAEAIEAKKLEKGKEATFLVQQAKDQIATAFFSFLAQKKQGATNYFNAITLENYEERASTLSTSSPSYSPDQLMGLKVDILTVHHTKEELKVIVDSILADKALQEHYAEEYQTSMEIFKKQLCDRLPSKKKELEAMAVANEEEKKRLENEKAKRIADEALAAQKEAEKLQAAAAAKNAAEAAQSEAAASMESAFAVLSSPAPQVKTGVEIIVKNYAAYALLFSFWFEKEGKNMEQGALERVTVARMKTFCQNYMLKTGESIESPYIEIKETFKAK